MNNVFEMAKKVEDLNRDFTTVGLIFPRHLQAIAKASKEAQEKKSQILKFQPDLSGSMLSFWW